MFTINVINGRESPVFTEAKVSEKADTQTLIPEF